MNADLVPISVITMLYAMILTIRIHVRVNLDLSEMDSDVEVDFYR